MYLSEIGKFAHQYWTEIPEHFTHIKLGAFIIMPNHIHGIINIEKYFDINVDTINNSGGVNYWNGGNIVGNTEKKIKNRFMSKISPKPGSISTIIRSYKSIVTKNSRKLNHNFGWQSRFYDIIIRDKKSYGRIEYYIINNPKKWQNDRFNR